MNPTDIFDLAGMITMPMWLLMIILPKWKSTQLLMDYKVVPICLSIIYVIFISIGMNKNGSFPDFSNLNSVMHLFTEENMVLAGWIHYLAFDLLIGMWMIDKNKILKINQLVMAPILFCTFMLGPVGFLLFTIIKTFYKSFIND